MAEIYTAFESEVKINEETVVGLQSIDYKVVRNQKSVGAVGTVERIAVYFGLKTVVGQLRVASAQKSLDGLIADPKPFSISATLKHGETVRHVAFDECYMEDKSFSMTAQGHGETIYSFTATRVREE